MKQIASALVKAQKEFGPALKTSTNPHFKNRYADLAACIEAVMDALNNNGIALMQPCHEVASGVMIETIFLHESGEIFSAGKLHVPAAKQDPQAYGSALTYARRYSLMAACGIAPEDDDGNSASKAQPPKLIGPGQAKEIHQLLQETQSDVANFLVWVSNGCGYAIGSVEAMPQSAFSPAVNQLTKKKEAK